LSKTTKGKLFDVLGPPRTEILTRIDGQVLEDGLPSQLVEAAGWDDWTEESTEDLRIIDLGEAFRKDGSTRRLRQPPAMRPPEAIFLGGCDYRVDLWCAGLMVRCGIPPFLRKHFHTFSGRFIHSYWDIFHLEALRMKQTWLGR
jgi:serine/threonine-protein kinase SRPK3